MQTFLAPYADALNDMVAASAEIDWVNLEPALGSAAHLDWADDVDASPWTTNALRRADRHGLLLLDAAASAFASVARWSRGPCDFPVLMAGLRVSIEANALAGSLLSPRLTARQRLEHFANLSLQDLSYRNSYFKALRKVTGSGYDLERSWLQQEIKELTETAKALLEVVPSVATDGVQFLGKRGSAQQRLEDLFEDVSPSGKMAQAHALAWYSLVSAPAHSSVSSVRLRFTAETEGTEGRRRVDIPTEHVTAALLLTATTQLRAEAMLLERFGLGDQHFPNRALQGLDDASRRLTEVAVAVESRARGAYPTGDTSS